MRKSLITALAGAVAVTLAGAAGAAELPKKMSWTAYGTTASGYAQSIAIGNALKNKKGVKLRVIAGKNDISRMAPLRDGKADYCACGIAVLFGQEGVFLFASNAWGPQSLHLVFSAIGSNNLALATAKDANIRTMADLKGKRISWVRGSDALNWNVAANLAFAGLTWDDVTKIRVGGFKASIDAIINGQSDAAFMSTITPHATRLAASPRGIFWPELPPSDKAGWARMTKAHPVNQMHTATSGAEISADKPHDGAVYPYPMLVTNSSRDAGEVEALASAIHELYNDFKDAAPGGAGWSIKNLNFKGGLPWHAGAIAFFKSQGVWSDSDSAHNDNLLKRQAILKGAWTALPNRTKLSKEDLKTKWMAARAAALSAAGMPLIFN